MHAWEMYVLREATEVMTQLNGHALLDVGSEYVVLSLAMAELWVVRREMKKINVK